MESLLPYYERELTYLRRLSHDFAKRYPKVASGLLLSGETCEDPHVERLIESFAFLTSRIHKKLDDEYPEITESLLSVVYPQYLRPFPSASIAHFDAGAGTSQLTGPVQLLRGTVLNTLPVKGVSCRFRTAYDVEILPVKLAAASYETNINTNGLRHELAMSTVAVIRLDVAATAETLGIVGAGVNKLRFFLNGDASLVSLIRESLFSKATGIWLSTPSSAETIELPLRAIQPVGFSVNETLLEPDARTHHAYSLMMEYFAYPEKFNFIDIDLSTIKRRIGAHVRELSIRIGLRDADQRYFSGNLLDRISKDNFVLGCAPVINLFDRKSEPINVTNTVSSYPVMVHSQQPHAFDIYSINRVSMVQKTHGGEQIAEFHPFYSVKHGQTPDGEVRYWHVKHADEERSENYPVEISLVDSTLDSLRPESSTLSIELTCTNRDLPSQLPFGLPSGDLLVEGGTLAKAIHFLRKPTRSFRFPRGRGAQWRLISHLSLNHLSLVDHGGDAFKEMLTLYNVTGAVSNGKQISGIVSIDSAPTTARITGNPFPTFARGLEIRVCVDEEHYVGTGLFMFAQILDHFFGLYVHTNSFTRLVIISKQSGQELIRCQPRSGESLLA